MVGFISNVAALESNGVAPAGGGCLYLLTSPSGKQYVGITSRTLEQRWREHCTEASAGRRDYPLYASMRKYGSENFKVEVLATGDWELLNFMEEVEVKRLRTQVPHGYNLRTGGNQSQMHPISRAKLSAVRKGRRSPKQLAVSMLRRGRPLVACIAANVGRKLSLETRARMSIAHRGKPLSDKQREYHLSRIGCPLSVEHRGKISKANTGKRCSAETRRRISESKRAKRENA